MLSGDLGELLSRGQFMGSYEYLNVVTKYGSWMRWVMSRPSARSFPDIEHFRVVAGVSGVWMFRVFAQKCEPCAPAETQCKVEGDSNYPPSSGSFPDRENRRTLPPPSSVKSG